jgi:hypothetical protein
MTVPATLPSPRRNLTQDGIISRFSGIVSTDIIVALGDYTGGAASNMFTLTSHGLVTGDVLYAVQQDTQGAILGGPGTRVAVTVTSSSVFTVPVTNTADGTVVFLKGNGIPQRVADAVRSLLIVCNNDTTGGTVEDMQIPYGGNIGDILVGDTLKLLYKSAAGVHPSTVDDTVYIIAPVQSVLHYYFQTSLTAGGASVDTTSDGTAVYLKTS